MKPLALAIALVLMSAAPASAKIPPRQNVLGLTLLIGGVLVAGAGAALTGYGFSLTRTATCPAWPQTTEVCGSVATSYQIAGWSILGLGLASSVAGGITLGVQAR